MNINVDTFTAITKPQFIYKNKVLGVENEEPKLSFQYTNSDILYTKNGLIVPVKEPTSYGKT